MININKMQAGREFDALIAEKVMGKGETWFGTFSNGSERTIPRLPHYSTDIAAAWLLVDKLTGPKVNLILERDWDGVYYSRFSSAGASDEDFCSADTAPLAICRAALKAVSPP